MPRADHFALRARHVISVAERQLVIAVRSNVYERLMIHLLRDGPLAGKTTRRPYDRNGRLSTARAADGMIDELGVALSLIAGASKRLD